MRRKEPTFRMTFKWRSWRKTEERGVWLWWCGRRGSYLTRCGFRDLTQDYDTSTLSGSHLLSAWSHLDLWQGCRAKTRRVSQRNHLASLSQHWLVGCLQFFFEIISWKDLCCVGLNILHQSIICFLNLISVKTNYPKRKDFQHLACFWFSIANSKLNNKWKSDTLVEK